MSSVRAEFERLLDAHLAGELTGEAQQRFEAMLQAEPALRAELELHTAISASLRERCAAPADLADRVVPRLSQPDGQVARLTAPGLGDHVVSRSADGVKSGSLPARRAGEPWLRRLAVAAVLLLGAFGVWQSWSFLFPDEGYKPGPWTPPTTVYHELIASGYEPMWICRNDQEFVDNTQKTLGQPLLFTQDDPEVRVVGLAYSHTLSSMTTLIMSYVDDKPVLVFADRLTADRALPAPAPETGLTWHRQEIGNVVLYELSPFDEPRVLPVLYQPEVGAPSV